MTAEELKNLIDEYARIDDWRGRDRDTLRTEIYAAIDAMGADAETGRLVNAMPLDHALMHAGLPHGKWIVYDDGDDDAIGGGETPLAALKQAKA